MTKKNPNCPRCGRYEGHYLNCPNSPRPGEIVINAFEEPEGRLLTLQDSCETEGCSNVKTGRQYCAECSTPAAQTRRSRARKKENASE